MEEKKSSGFMLKIASFIIDKRRAVYLVFIVAIIYSVVSIPKVVINNDITSYLPETTETRRGLDIMEREFVTYGTAEIMVSNITYETAEEISAAISGFNGVSEVEFGDDDKHYANVSALFKITFDDEADSEISINAINTIYDYISGYDYYVNTEVGADPQAELQQEMNVILVIVAAVILLVLFFTSQSYMEIPIFIIVFAVAALLNMGTNHWFGEISFVTNSIAVVLQLALAIDYAIIFLHRFMEEKEHYDTREAAIYALSKAIPEIFSSSLTTISGMIALMLMQLRIGFDMGSVMTKSIICSLLTVFLLMPGLVMLFSKGIERSRHKSFVPRITFWGKIVVFTRYILPFASIIIIAAGCYYSQKTEYAFDTGSVTTEKVSDSAAAKKKITDMFGKSNTLAVIVPKGDYESEAEILSRGGSLSGVRSTLGLANVNISDEYILTDRVTPRQFSEFAGVDIELSRLLFSAYALDTKEYGAIINDIDSYDAPIIDVFLFLCRQREEGIIEFDDEEINEYLDELYETLSKAVLQLRGENYTRLVFTLDTDTESEEAYALLEEIRNIADDYYDEVVLAGNTTSAHDLKSSFDGDNIKISILTVLFVAIILLFTFKSSGLPVMLVFTIQGSIWINFAITYLRGENIYFLSYLIVSAIQMGATIDYAIVITNRYVELKQKMNMKQAVIETLNQSFPTILTSGSILAVAGTLIGNMSSDPTISSIGNALGRGTLISILLVMAVLPQILMLGDIIIEKTAITLANDNFKKININTALLDGHVKGYIKGYIDADVKGALKADLNAHIKTDKEEDDDDEI